MLSIILLTPFAATNGLPPNSSIIVDTTPNSVRPYALPKYKGDAIKLTSSQTIRFSITANSSDGAFSLLQHNGKASGWLSARPHTHGVTHEHLYCTRGRCQLWGQKNATNSSHEARVATPGDYGNIPQVPSTHSSWSILTHNLRMSSILAVSRNSSRSSAKETTIPMASAHPMFPFQMILPLLGR